MRKAVLHNTHLHFTDLWDAKLQDALLDGAHLQKATLVAAWLQGACLQWADLSGARLAEVRIDHETDFSNAGWGDHVLGEELAGEFEQAEAVYRMLKEWHRQHGHYDVASEFAYPENEARRKARWRHVKELWHQLWQPTEASAR